MCIIHKISIHFRLKCRNYNCLKILKFIENILVQENISFIENISAWDPHITAGHRQLTTLSSLTRHGKPARYRADLTAVRDGFYSYVLPLVRSTPAGMDGFCSVLSTPVLRVVSGISSSWRFVSMLIRACEWYWLEFIRRTARYRGLEVYS